MEASEALQPGRCSGDWWPGHWRVSSAVEAACAPFQFALSTRAGVDCVGHAVRAATDANPMTTVLSLNGIGAYDHVFRASVMSKLLEVPSLHHLLPFVRQAYGSATSYS